MRTFRLNKLVRDKVVPDMRRLDQTVNCRELTDAEYLVALHRKMSEELAEFDPTGGKALEELADLKEVIDALTKCLGSTLEKMHIVQTQKAAEKGAFETKMYVESVTLSDYDPWVGYYESSPTRFPELI